VGSGVLQAEAGSEKRCLEQEHNEILDGLVVLVQVSLLLQLLDDGVLGVQLEVLLGGHVAWRRKRVSGAD